jgi:hypothetical protein
VANRRTLENTRMENRKDAINAKDIRQNTDDYRKWEGEEI